LIDNTQARFDGRFFPSVIFSKGETMSDEIRTATENIRQLVKIGGWDAVRKHPELSKVWEKSLKESRDYVNAVIDR